MNAQIKTECNGRCNDRLVAAVDVTSGIMARLIVHHGVSQAVICVEHTAYQSISVILYL